MRKQRIGLLVFCIIGLIFCIGMSPNLNIIVENYTESDGIAQPNQSGITFEFDQIANIFSGNYTQEVVLDDSYAYVGDSNLGLQIVDISDPSSPIVMGGIYDGGTARGIFVRGSYAYIADGTDGLEIIDITIPTAPVEVGQFDDGGSAYEVFVSGTYAYVADGSDGLEIINVTNPFSPTEVAQFDDGGTAYGVHVSGSYAFVADGNDGLEVIDISNPLSPTEIGNFVGLSVMRDITVVGNTAYATEDSGYGVIILDITDPTTFSTFHNYGAGFVTDIEVSGQYAYLGRSYGVSVVDVSNVDILRRVGTSGNIGQVQNLDVSGSYLYCAGLSNGLKIFNLTVIENEITVLTPNIDSDAFGTGETLNITWSSKGLIDGIVIELYEDDELVQTINDHYWDQGNYSWSLHPYLRNSEYYQVRIQDRFDDTTYDYSHYFTIYSTRPSPFKIPGFNVALMSVLCIGISIILALKVKKRSYE